MNTKYNILVSLAAVCVLATSASAADISETVRLGNEAVAEGKFDEALATYQQAAADEPTRAELLYNQAVAHYRKGEYEQARGLFTQATAAKDRQLEAKARFNLADCDYAEAVALAEKDKPAAIERLNRAISHYRGALQSNPDEGDARANIELAQMLIKKLQEEEKQDQQKQDQKQDQQKQDQKQDQQKQDQQKSDEQQQDQQEQDQQQQGEQKREQQEQDQQQQDQQKSGEQKEDQQQQEDQQHAGQPQTADQDQQLQGAPQYGGESAAEQEARPMTKEEAQKMLQAVRDRDLMRRLEQLEQRRSRHVPVDKDW